MEPPKFDPSEKTFHVSMNVLDTMAWYFVENVLGLSDGDEDRENDEVSLSQLAWLAHLDPKEMQGHAREILKMLAHFGLQEFMPIDNRLAIGRGAVL